MLGSLKRMAKLTLEEKRLKSLKLQLFGKEHSIKPVTPKTSGKSHFDLKPQDMVKHASVRDDALNMSYIKGDLLKILALVSLVMSFQLILYFANLNNLISLKF